jgi:hypothetical protein
MILLMLKPVALLEQYAPRFMKLEMDVGMVG